MADPALGRQQGVGPAIQDLMISGASRDEPALPYPGLRVAIAAVRRSALPSSSTAPPACIGNHNDLEGCARRRRLPCQSRHDDLKEARLFP